MPCKHEDLRQSPTPMEKAHTPVTCALSGVKTSKLMGFADQLTYKISKFSERLPQGNTGEIENIEPDDPPLAYARTQARTRPDPSGACNPIAPALFRLVTLNVKTKWETFDS